MADRRCYSKSICLSDAFLDMPHSTRCLYFTLLLCADDDGFVNNPRSIMRQTSATDDDMKLLIAKKFVLIFETGVIVIKHWRIHNTIQKDRYTPTKCVDEMASLMLDENKAYTTMDTPCIQSVSTMETQVNLIKDNLIKDNLIKDNLNKDNGDKTKRFIKPSLEEVNDYIAEKGYNVNGEQWYSFYVSNGWKVGKNPMKDWKACIAQWNYRDNKQAIITEARPVQRVYTSDEMNTETNDFASIRAMMNMRGK